jgi:protein-S-isoprenylcysteine O-methyltransferase Ste14
MRYYGISLTACPPARLPRLHQESSQQRKLERASQPIMKEHDISSPSRFNRVKLLDFISRIVPSSFFLYVVLLKVVELYVFLKGHPAAGNNTEFLRFLADVVSKSSIICFLGLMSLLFLIRLEPIEKARGIVPRVTAIAGTFFISLVTFFPRANLTMVQTVIASLICLLGTALSIFVLTHLGRSYSLMAEARRLVTTGPYGIIRHPLYVVEEVAAVAVVIQFLSFNTMLIFILHLLIQFQRMRNEEAVLEKAFPEYQAYKASTARLIPGVY